MAAKFSSKERIDSGLSEIRKGTLDLDNSYPSGGYILTAKELGFRVGSNLDAMASVAAQGYVFALLPGGNDGEKLLAVFEAPGAAGPLQEVANATDLSGVIEVPVVFFGR